MRVFGCRAVRRSRGRSALLTTSTSIQAHLVRGPVAPRDEVRRYLAQARKLLGEGRIIRARDLDLVPGRDGNGSDVVGPLVVEVVVAHVQDGLGLGRAGVEHHLERPAGEVHVGPHSNDVAGLVDRPHARRRVTLGRSLRISTTNRLECVVEGDSALPKALTNVGQRRRPVTQCPSDTGGAGDVGGRRHEVEFERQQRRVRGHCVQHHLVLDGLVADQHVVVNLHDDQASGRKVDAACPSASCRHRDRGTTR